MRGAIPINNVQWQELKHITLNQITSRPLKTSQKTGKTIDTERFLQALTNSRTWSEYAQVLNHLVKQYQYNPAIIKLIAYRFVLKTLTKPNFRVYDALNAIYSSYWLTSHQNSEIQRKINTIDAFMLGLRKRPGKVKQSQLNFINDIMDHLL